MSAVAAPREVKRPPTKVQRWTRTSMVFAAGTVGLVVLLALVPYMFGPNTTEKLTELFVLIILAAMWNALAGYGGLVSVGQQAFIGIGAYAVIVLTDHGINGYLAVVLAALFCGLVSLPTSMLVFRLRGGQFAIGMWVVAELFRLLVTNDQSLGGGTGRSLDVLNAYSPANRQAYTYWVALALMTALVLLGFVLLRSRLGSSLQAIRDDERAAESIGVPVTRAKRIVFLLAGIGCGAAGAITIANSLIVTPDSIFSVQWSAFMIFMVLVGGLGTFEGPVLGALVLFGIQQEFSNDGSWYLVGLGVAAILFAVIFPRGLWGWVVDRFNIRLVPVGYTLRQLIGSQATTPKR
ncbi:MAG TPA: branched-chain amino acid ABC transporter permease [Solirubrobacteraceae bacterium]|nr:branched-chain amino acid ABC transporter permease [Solirubrobacteraceae bacterium]